MQLLVKKCLTLKSYKFSIIGTGTLKITRPIKMLSKENIMRKKSLLF
jgi:hypothetical protein